MAGGRSEIARTIYIVRHGQSLHHVNGFTGGWTDLSLTRLGRRQAKRTALRLARCLKCIEEGGRTALYTSDLKRAAETAAVIASRTGLVPQCFPALRDLNNGEAAGMIVERAAEIRTDPTEPLLDWVPYRGAETWRQMSERVIGFLDEHLTGEFGSVIIVSHANAIEPIIHWWIGNAIDDHARVSFETDPCSLTVLRRDQWGGNAISRLNDTSHL